MPEAPSPVSLSERLKIVRRHLWLVMGIACVVAVVVLVFSLAQPPSYEAQTSVQFRDETRDLALLGGLAQPADQPAQLAAASAGTVTRPQLLTQVKKDLKTSWTVDRLRNATTATPDPRSNLVILNARADTAPFAARLANAVARRATSSVNQASRRRFSDAAESLRERLDRTAAENGGGAEGTARRSATSAVLAEQLSNLEALASFASPAQWVQRAEVPSEPVSPKPVRNTVLAGLFGLFLGLGAAFVRDSLDRRLRGTQEIQEHLPDLTLLGHVRTRVMGKVAFCDTGHAELEGPDLEAFRILRTNLEFLDVDSPPRIVAVTSPLPEEGKTTVAGSLAFAAAAAGKQTLLVECDLRRPALSGRLGLQRSPGLSDVLAGQADALEVIQIARCTDPPLLSSGNSNGKVEPGFKGAGREGRPPSLPGAEHPVACVAAGSPTSRPAELLGSQRLRDFLEKLSDDYELIVLDTSPLLPVADTIELLPLVDGVLMCVRMGQTTREQARAGKAVLDRVPTRLSGLVITGAEAAGDYEYGYYAYAHDYSAAET